MADRTGIEWTDATWNPVRGCSRVSAGCQHCYAERVAARFSGPGQPYEGLIHPSTGGWNGKVRLVPEVLQIPLRWRRPRRIFVNSMSDLFHEMIPDEFIDQVFAVMAQAPRHTFQVLTKRPERARTYLRNQRRLEKIYAQWYGTSGTSPEAEAWPLPNVWLGVSVEDQAAADQRIPLLLQCPAAVRWISAEPLLGAVDLTQVYGVPHNAPFSVLDNKTPQGSVRCVQHAIGYCMGDCGGRWPALDWVVAGGESGPSARPMHPDWARSLRDQCAAAGVPFLFKQWGEWGPIHAPLREGVALDPIGIDGDTPMLVDTSDPCGGLARRGKKAAGRHLDGVLHDGYPDARTRALEG